MAVLRHASSLFLLSFSFVVHSVFVCVYFFSSSSSVQSSDTQFLFFFLLFVSLISPRFPLFFSSLLLPFSVSLYFPNFPLPTSVLPHISSLPSTFITLLPLLPSLHLLPLPLPPPLSHAHHPIPSQLQELIFFGGFPGHVTASWSISWAANRFATNIESFSSLLRDNISPVKELRGIDVARCKTYGGWVLCVAKLIGDRCCVIQDLTGDRYCVMQHLPGLVNLDAITTGLTISCCKTYSGKPLP